ncbi:hypothetical protein SERLADRAFT_400591 [Serpula lacrymans var. lacrymans S7.9]|uniref:Uncharacterized protein n=1 Tax=Serpula lacrymans var. lacrymans (strain S7.9) TaxID=578457 RepID=F8P9K9_SERL9|nr:uncharacterized protein SERLADRAFT_400591 [Serpula lacrymans var. lacrymans S7.9]EGO20338.1 hypothetical protein SERLADRAFT_400591 [Serpula lacrymans var. lacrymans S7.9]
MSRCTTVTVGAIVGFAIVVHSCIQLINHGCVIIYVDWVRGRVSLRPVHCARRTVFLSGGGDLEYHLLPAASGSSSVRQVTGLGVWHWSRWR